jgi:hypothetical protein
MATPLTRTFREQNLRICSPLRILPLVLLLLTGRAAVPQDLAATSAPLVSEKTTREVSPVLWQDPTDIAVRDLCYGEGGQTDAPRTIDFAFVKEDLSGTNPKFVVTDRDGVQWKIKLGEEAKPEVAASRLVWAVGYFTNEDYYLAEIHIAGLPAKLHRGRQFIGAGGIVRDARMQRMDKTTSKKIGNWPWKQGPFAGTRELNGLRALMAVINNWDLKDINNKVFAEKGREAGVDPPKQTYIVSDLGASFGTTGFVVGLRKSRGNLEAFRSSRFVTKVRPQYVDFATPSRATLLDIFNPPEFFMRLHLRWIGKRVPRSDAKWMASLLARLSPEQIRDAFRAAGYSPDEVEGFAEVLEKRISILNDI